MTTSFSNGRMYGVFGYYNCQNCQQYVREKHASKVAAMSADCPFLYEDTSIIGRLRRLRRSANCAIGRTTTRTSKMLNHVGEPASNGKSNVEDMAERNLESMSNSTCKPSKGLRLSRLFTATPELYGQCNSLLVED